MDYYEFLEIPRTATDEDVKKAYHKKSLLYHPDKNNNDENLTTKFKQCQEVYQVLSNPQKRQAYDHCGCPKTIPYHLKQICDVDVGKAFQLELQDIRNKHYLLKKQKEFEEWVEFYRHHLEHMYDRFYYHEVMSFDEFVQYAYDNTEQYYDYKQLRFRHFRV
jgi:curved DNA-binding protein CbpA